MAVHHLDRIVDDFKAGNLIRCPVGQCSTCEKIIPGNMVKLGNYTFEVRGHFDCRSTNTCFVVTLETGEQQSMYGFLHVLSNGQRNYAARRVYIDDISLTSLYRSTRLYRRDLDLIIAIYFFHITVCTTTKPLYRALHDVTYCLKSAEFKSSISNWSLSLRVKNLPLWHKLKRCGSTEWHTETSLKLPPTTSRPTPPTRRTAEKLDLRKSFKLNFDLINYSKFLFMLILGVKLTC